MQSFKRHLLESSPRSLYASRPLLNREDVVRWAKDQGVKSIQDPRDFHVTIVHSRKPIVWPEPIREDHAPSATHTGLVKLGRATAIHFNCPILEKRHRELLDSGCESDFPTYLPHVTISWDPNFDTTGVAPYEGPLHFGPEEFREVDDDWESKVRSVDL